MTNREIQKELDKIKKTGYKGVPTLKVLLSRLDKGFDYKSQNSLQTILEYGFPWEESKEGYTYWDNLCDSIDLGDEIVIAHKGVAIPEYPILKDGKYWSVGCQRIDRKGRLKLFKLLAKDLGYELI